MALPFLLRRVELRNYRSIEHCDVELGPLMFLVGPNGSGKSNFLDALRFVSDCLNTSVDQALRVRGGFKSVCRISSQLSNRFSIKLTFDLNDRNLVDDIITTTGQYYFEIAAESDRPYQISREEFRATSSHNSDVASYERKGVELIRFEPEDEDIGISHLPEPSEEHLYLATLAGWRGFKIAHRALRDMAFYNPSTELIREYQRPDLGDRLDRSASNLASVFRTLRKTNPDWAERVLQYLSVVVPRLQRVVDSDVGEKITLQFIETGRDGESEKTFYSSSMSDGTLRMLAILVALFQRSEPEQRISLVGIEEPEMGLHPAAAEVLFDSLNEASAFRQILVTSHSSELLDHDNVDADSLLAVSAESGSTIIGPIDDRQKTILKKKLGTAGELLRRDLLQPNELSHK